MIEAITEYGELIPALPEYETETGYCPECGLKLILALERNNSGFVSRWRHPKGTSCRIAEKETVWHTGNKACFPVEYREVLIKDLSMLNMSKGSYRRADVFNKSKKLVVEFQQSYDSKMLNERDIFYHRLGLSLAWVFNTSRKDLEFHAPGVISDDIFGADYFQWETSTFDYNRRGSRLCQI